MTAQIRKWWYLGTALLSSLVPILVATHAISGEKGASWLAAVAAIGGLFGATGAGTAAVVVHKQEKNGAFAPSDPVQAVIDNIPVVVANANSAVSDLNKVKNAAADLASIIPGIGPLASAVIDSVKLP